MIPFKNIITIQLYSTQLLWPSNAINISFDILDTDFAESDGIFVMKTIYSGSN